MRIGTFLLAAVILIAASGVTYPNELTDKLQSASVTINAGQSQGSGVFVTRMIENKEITFILTAGHVIDHLKRTRKEIKDGKEFKVVMFDDVGLVQEFQQDGRKVGESKFIARVVRYSDADLGEDLAILQVRKYNFTKASVEFYLDDKIPEIGTELYHVGSLLGQVGSNSLTTGIISQTGRVLNLAGGEGVVFDQTTATAFPGSSGGGVFRKSDGLYVGTLVRGAGEGFNLIVPVRRLRAWCEKVDCTWVVDPKAKLPTLDALSKMVPNDVADLRAEGVARFFNDSDNRKYPTLLKNPPIPVPADFLNDHGEPAPAP